MCCVANRFHIAEDLGKKLKHSSDYLVCLTNMLQSGNFTWYLIGTYWAQWLKHARKFKTKWHCWKLVCVHCCVAMIKLIIWMYGVFIIYVMQLLVKLPISSHLYLITSHFSNIPWIYFMISPFIGRYATQTRGTIGVRVASLAFSGESYRMRLFDE